jgi:hypothetical protein
MGVGRTADLDAGSTYTQQRSPERVNLLVQVAALRGMRQGPRRSGGLAR